MELDQIIVFENQCKTKRENMFLFLQEGICLSAPSLTSLQFHHIRAPVFAFNT